MLSKANSFSLVFFFAIALSACSESPPDQALTSPSNSAISTNATMPYSTDITIREVMNSLIDPHADALWNSVRVISDSNGITEFVPETDEEWASLRISAISIIEGANSLMMPGRKVAPPGAVGEFPEYEFTPEEVEEILLADPQSWIGYSQGLQSAALGILGAIDNKDTEQLSEWGAYLDGACESCHANYWYREGI